MFLSQIDILTPARLEVWGIPGSPPGELLSRPS